MFGRILNISDSKIEVEIKKESNVIPNLMNLHVVFVSDDSKLLGEVRNVLEDKIIVELKSVKDILPEHRVQLFNYMRLTKKRYAILINFGEMSLHCERYFYDENINECYLVDKNLNRINY